MGNFHHFWPSSLKALLKSFPSSHARVARGGGSAKITHAPTRADSLSDWLRRKPLNWQKMRTGFLTLYIAKMY